MCIVYNIVGERDTRNTRSWFSGPDLEFIALELQLPAVNTLCAHDDDVRR